MLAADRSQSRGMPNVFEVVMDNKSAEGSGGKRNNAEQASAPWNKS
jgi:hypothetical protein